MNDPEHLNDKDIIDQIRKYTTDLYTNRPHSHSPPVVAYLDPVMTMNKHIQEVLKGSGIRVIVVSSADHLRSLAKESGIHDLLILEKITALAQGMRSDLEPPDLRDVVRIMPKATVPEKESRRPSLPKNRKRDRWN